MSNRFKYKKSEKQDGINYLQQRVIPDRFKTKRDRDRFEKKWSAFKYFPRADEFWTIKGNKQLIFREDLKGVLKHDVYDEPRIGLVGRDKLFYRVKKDYVGISRKDVSEFLKNHETQQVLSKVRKNVPQSRGHSPNNPLVTWEADLTFITKPESKIFLNIIDRFSKYAWAFEIPNKSGATVAKVFDDLFKRESPHLPKTLHTDNGTEFVNKKLKAILKKWNIKHSLSRPYIFQDASFVERFNLTFKRLLNMYSVQWNNRFITKSIVRELIINYNSSYHSSIKTEPKLLHPGKNRSGVMQADIIKARRNMKKRAMTIAQKYRLVFKGDLKVGDKVRARMDVMREPLNMCLKNNSRGFGVLRYMRLYMLEEKLNH
eukprot:TRINITY_DN8782_c0_g1_i1.p1 TRINITY_DN8782_c0_g1~~TRINITY_DN8782_c0_g1_i1.p1  ORF type:complete len:373 (-),score=49.97 TRINITY_DN8782_c0_g1_i1:67-1185(-)